MKPRPINIPEPCHESWTEMTPTEQGKFCSSCQKCVTDFTSMSNDEIATFLKKNTQDICGRIGTKQLERFNKSLKTSSKWYKWKWAATLTGLTLALPTMGQTTDIEPLSPDPEIEWKDFFDVSEEEQTVGKGSIDVDEKRIEQETKTGLRITDGIIRGYIFDNEDKEPLIGVNIAEKGTTNGTVTDIDGYFELESKKELNRKINTTIIVSYLGYEEHVFNVNPKSYSQKETYIYLEESEMMLGDVITGGVHHLNIFARTWHGIKNIFRKKH